MVRCIYFGCLKLNFNKSKFTGNVHALIVLRNGVSILSECTHLSLVGFDGFYDLELIMQSRKENKVSHQYKI